MKKAGLSSFALHILAMAFMLTDHIWLTLVTDNLWMTCIGRLAFPIFAFLATEGYFHTHSLKNYLIRLAALAVISEVPFNLMAYGEIFYPLHQNVIWTLLIGVIGISIMERAKAKGSLTLSIITDAAVIIVGAALGYLCFTDYYGAGVLTVFVFYFFKDKSVWSCLGHTVFLAVINGVLLPGQQLPLSLLGLSLHIPLQLFAVLSLIPIWLYNGRQGISSKLWRYACYAFYPVHMLILYLIAT